jgi:outer membrane lipoprotein-sorting protein
MKLILLTLLALTFITQPPTSALAMRQAKHLALTLVSRVTVTQPDGRQEVTEVVRYVSSDGSVRRIRKNEDGSVSSDYVFEKGRGGFFIRHDEKKLVKSWITPPEAIYLPHPVTAESIRKNPNFLRTETVLGYTTYVVRDLGSGISSGGGSPADALHSELYFAPELGKTPLKEVHYRDGKVVTVYEPVKVTFGEPDAALMKAPDYEVASTIIAGGILNGKAVSKPSPVWPAEASDMTGTVMVEILADEKGKVIEANAVSGPEQLRQAAVDAAFKAKLSPTRLSGQPVKFKGVLIYNFIR